MKRKRIKRFFQRRQHPVIMITYIAKYLWLLVIPLTKYLIAVRFDLKSWIETNWVDILTVSVIVAYAFVRWICVYFEMEDDAVVAHTGFFGITQTKVYFSEISSVTFSQGYLFRAVHACSLYIDTDARSIQQADIYLQLHKKQAVQIIDKITDNSQCQPKYVYHSKRWEMMIFSLLFSSTLSGMIILVSLIYESNKIVDRALEQRFIEHFNSQIEKAYDFVPKYFLIAGLLIAGSWLLSFITNLMRHWNFSCTRCGDKFIINSGKGTKRQHVLIRERIIYIDYQQSMLMKLFKICSVSAKCTGYGKASKEFSALIPITTVSQATESLKLLIPGIPDTENSVKTRKSDIRRFVTIPALCCFIPPVAWYILKSILPMWSKEIRMIAILVYIPLVWLTMVKFGSAFSTGIGVSKKEDCISFSYCKLYKFHKVVVRTSKISMIRIKQYPWQKRTGICSVIIYTNSEKHSRHIIKYINYNDAVRLLSDNGLYFRR
ncbi:MAG: PH domain-containing protein [Hominimerdicola sp.]